jgi:hypothetical protein
MKAIYLVAGLGILLGLTACGNLVQDVTIDNIPTARIRMVVQGYLCPQDTAIAIFVDNPTSVLGLYTNADNDFRPVRFPIDSAFVDLSDGTRTVRLGQRNTTQAGRYSPSLYYGISTRAFPVVAGRTYTLTVSRRGYPSVSARCTVPAGVTPTRIQVDSTREQNGQGAGVRFAARLSWPDPANAPNFYKIDVTAQYDIPSRITTGQTVRDTVFRQTYTLPPRDNVSELYTDTNRNGQTLVSATYEPFFTGQGAGGVKRAELLFRLLHLDEPMCRFLKGVEQQRAQGDNPFAEPVLIPSNIEGGLGCFGGYNRAEQTVRLR